MDVNADAVEVKRLSWQAGEADLSELRRQVFIEEQKVPQSDEWDGADPSADHFLAVLPGGEAIGCARLLPNGKIGRMAVLEPYRRHGIGSKILQTVITYAQERQVAPPYLDAQVQALDFYRRFGFVAEGDEFQDAGIAHRRMRLVEHQDPRLQQFNSPSEAQAALVDCVSAARTTLDLLTDQLPASLYGQKAFVGAVSTLARRSRRSQVRVLVKDTRPLKGANHPLVLLGQRLPSRIGIRQLTEMPQDARLSFCLADAESLVRFSSEAEFTGFSNRAARPEARALLQEFNHLWEHYGVIDPNLKAIFI